MVILCRERSLPDYKVNLTKSLLFLVEETESWISIKNCEAQLIMAHIFLSISLLFLMASDLASAATGLSKPAIIPKFDLDGSLETQLRSVLPQATWNSTNWAPGWVPQACSDAARDNNLQAADFTVINVTYSDCSDPWVLCYHKNSPMTQTDVLNVSYIKFIISLSFMSGQLVVNEKVLDQLSQH